MLNILVSRISMWFRSVESKEEGQGLIEYALIVLLIALGVLVVLGLVGGQVQDVFQQIADALSGATATP
ncbi:MAG: Flp family type IVb pilin [Chloroflexota bacterium]|nr:Flp family type IVb pilin [Chloroflexota bacterium]